MQNRIRIWKYKDANRVWWRLEASIGEADTTRSIAEQHDGPDHWWDYKLINDDTGTAIVSGEVWGQYDLMPNINTFLADIQNQINHLCLGMAKYAEK